MKEIEFFHQENDPLKTRHLQRFSLSWESSCCRCRCATPLHNTGIILQVIRIEWTQQSLVCAFTFVFQLQFWLKLK